MTTSKDLIEFIKSGAIDKLRDALAEDPSLASSQTDGGISILQLATYTRNKAAIELIKEKKPLLNLFEAAGIGDVGAVTREIETQPDRVNSFSADGFTPLGLACFFGHYDVAYYLIEQGADVNKASNNSFKVAPIHSACAISDVELTRLLLKNGANVNLTQQAGITPLHEAAHNGKTLLAKLLIDHGAILKAKNDAGKTALMIAIEKGFPETADLIKSQGG